MSLISYHIILHVTGYLNSQIIRLITTKTETFRLYILQSFIGFVFTVCMFMSNRYIKKSDSLINTQHLSYTFYTECYICIQVYIQCYILQVCTHVYHILCSPHYRILASPPIRRSSCAPGCWQQSEPQSCPGRPSLRHQGGPRCHRGGGGARRWRDQESGQLKYFQTFEIFSLN